MKRILVTGATGKQGGAVARALLREGGYVVRAVTRNPNSESARRLRDMGAELVAADLSDSTSVHSAVEGSEGIFSVQNYWDSSVGFDGEIAQARNLAAAAKSAGVAHFVQSTMASADNVADVAHFESKRQVEKLLSDQGIPHTLLGTVFFMDNLLDPRMGGKMTFPVLSGSLKKRTRLHLLHSDDIGEAVRQVLSRPAEFIGSRVNLAGDELTVAEMKDVYRRVTGKRPKWYALPRFALRMMAREFSEQLDWHNKVNFQFSLDESRARFPHLTSLEQFLRLHNVTGL